MLCGIGRRQLQAGGGEGGGLSPKCRSQRSGSSMLFPDAPPLLIGKLER